MTGRSESNDLSQRSIDLSQQAPEVEVAGEPDDHSRGLSPGVDVREDARAAVRFAGQALAESTRRAYTSDWARYELWCEERDLEPLPPDPGVIAMFLSHHAALVRPARPKKGAEPKPGEPPKFEPLFARSTIDRWVAALTWVFHQEGHVSPFDHPDVENTLAGIRREIGPKREVRRMDPLLLTDLLRVFDAMRTSWPQGVATIRDRFLLLVGFAGAFRRSELCDMLTDHVTVDRHDGLRIRLPKSKTDQEGGGMVKAIPYGTQPRTCGPCATWHWWAVLAAGADRDARKAVLERYATTKGHVCRDEWPQVPDGVPVLRRIDRHGNVGHSPITGHAINLIIKKRADAAGLDDPRLELAFGGHSLRAGFVTQSINAGASVYDVMTQTGHKNESTVRTYVRNHSPLANNSVTRLGL